MTSHQIPILFNDILKGFPKVNPPRYGEITVEITLDGRRVTSDFEGENWWEISFDLLREHYDALPLLTPAAYHYYLPAYLMASLENFAPHDYVLEFTVYSLSPTKTASDDTFLFERIRRFSDSEKVLVERFLSLILEDESMYSLFNDARRGLRKFWVPTAPQD